MDEEQRKALARLINGHDSENEAGGAMYTDSDDIELLRPLVEDLRGPLKHNIFDKG